MSTLFARTEDFAWKLSELTAEEQANLPLLREAIKEDAELNQMCDHELATFLLARKNDVQRAVELIRKNIAWRKEFQCDKMDDVMLGKIKRFLMSGMFQYAEFSARAPPGSSCVVYLFPKLIPLDMMHDDMIMMQATHFLATRSFFQHIDNARHGMVLVEDFEGVELRQLMKMAGDNKRNKNSFDALQDTMPGRLRLCLLTSAPWWIRIPFKMVSVFMKPKLRRKFRVASRAEVSEILGHAAVPNTWGGKHKDFDANSMIERFPELERIEFETVDLTVKA